MLRENSASSNGEPADGPQPFPKDRTLTPSYISTKIVRGATSAHMGVIFCIWEKQAEEKAEISSERMKKSSGKECQPSRSSPSTSAAIRMTLFQSRRGTSRPRKRCDAQGREKSPNLTAPRDSTEVLKIVRSTIQHVKKRMTEQKIRRDTVGMWDTMGAEKKYVTIPNESRKKIFNRQTCTPYSNPDDRTPIKDSK